MSSLRIDPVGKPVSGMVRPPGSKSITNRALVVAALAEGTSRLTGVLDSQDTRVMIESLGQLGVAVRHDATAATAEVQGCAGLPPAKSAELWLENSGTSIRFLTAVACLGNGRFFLDGNARMRQRPIGDLCETLGALGANVSSTGGFPPVSVVGRGLPGGTAEIEGGVSSQYLSAILMASPCARSPVELALAGKLVSEPYIDMTIRVMQAFGARVDSSESAHYRIQPQHYVGQHYAIEPDASAASYFLAAAAITGGTTTIVGLSKASLQGDVRFADVLEQMGCRVDWNASSITVHGGPIRGIDVDMNAISDTVQTLCAVAMFADGPTRIRNVAHIRQKETDRIHAVVTELRRLGIHADESEEGLTIYPGPAKPATVETYDDHRMAMSFALVGLRVPGIRIANPECTAKTYPGFFDDLKRLFESGA